MKLIGNTSQWPGLIPLQHPVSVIAIVQLGIVDNFCQGCHLFWCQVHVATCCILDLNILSSVDPFIIRSLHFSLHFRWAGHYISRAALMTFGCWVDYCLCWFAVLPCKVLRCIYRHSHLQNTFQCFCVGLSLYSITFFHSRMHDYFGTLFISFNVLEYRNLCEDKVQYLTFLDKGSAIKSVLHGAS